MLVLFTLVKSPLKLIYNTQKPSLPPLVAVDLNNCALLIASSYSANLIPNSYPRPNCIDLQYYLFKS